MRWILGIVGVLIAVILVVVVIGYMLPQSHVASMSAQYATPPESLWTSLTDVQAFPQWRPGVTRVEPLPDENGQRGWREHANGDVVTYRVIEADPPRRLVARIADENLPYGGTWTYELAPATAGTRLTITERGEVYNPVFRFVSRFVLGYTGSMDGVLRALGSRHGETVAPAVVSASPP
jgi:uncharacterized protein YndB with AHSA1/START domain